MQDIIVRKQLYPLAKQLNVKHRSLGKYQMSVPLALIGHGYVKVQPRVGAQINYLNLKRENIVVVKKVDVSCSQDSFSKSEDTSGDYEEVGDTDSMSSLSS